MAARGSYAGVVHARDGNRVNADVANVHKAIQGRVTGRIVRLAFGAVNRILFDINPQWTQNSRDKTIRLSNRSSPSGLL